MESGIATTALHTPASAHRDPQRSDELRIRLATGRRRVLLRAFEVGAARGALWILAACIAFATGIRWLGFVGPERGEDYSAALATMGGGRGAVITGALIIIFIICFGFRAVSDARRRWPSIWDLTLGLPQTIVTLAEVQARSHPSTTFVAAFLDSTSTPLPPFSRLAKALPWRLHRALGANFVVVASFFALGIAQAMSASPPHSIVVHAPDAAAAARARAIIEASSALTPDHRQALNSALQAAATSDRALGAAFRHGAEFAADEWLKEARARLRDRLDAMEQLSTLAGTRPLAEWLRGARAVPALVDRELSPGERAALERAAAALAARFPELANALDAAAARGRLPDAASLPTVPPVDAELRDATWVAEIVRGTRDLPASFAGAAPTSSGSEPRPRDAGRPNAAPESATEDPSHTRESPLVINPDHQIADRERTASSHTPLPGGDPHWLELCTRPEIEARWYGVLERYRSRQHESRP
ncbi:MAG: hypothetical protein ACKVX7_02200 [Planctomycetota bacterium]